MKSIWAKLKYILFALYCITILVLLFFRDYDYSGVPYLAVIKQHINYIPFDSTCKYFRVFMNYGMHGIGADAFKNIVGNLILLVPFGIMVPNLFKRFDRFFLFFFTTFFIILLAETIQLFTLRGVFDVDDIMLNLTGAVFGYAIQKLTKCFIKIKRL